MISMVMSALVLGEASDAVFARQRLEDCIYSAADYFARSRLSAERVADAVLLICSPQRIDLSRATNGRSDDPAVDRQLRSAVVFRVTSARTPNSPFPAGR